MSVDTLSPHRLARKARPVAHFEAADGFVVLRSVEMTSQFYVVQENWAIGLGPAEKVAPLAHFFMTANGSLRFKSFQPELFGLNDGNSVRERLSALVAKSLPV